MDPVAPLVLWTHSRHPPPYHQLLRRATRLKRFRIFQRAGVNFELPGTSIVSDGEQLIVTQTRRNLERMRTILRNYNEVKQVEIEAKFLEVSQGDLEEFGVDWVGSDGNQAFSFGAPSQILNSEVVLGTNPTG